MDNPLRSTRLRVVATAALALTAIVGAAPQAQAASGGDWPMGGQNLWNTRSVDTPDGPTPRNAGKLAIKWTFETHGDVSATPAVTKGAVYFPDWGGYLNKVSASSGALIWQRKLSTYGYNDDEANVSRTTPAVVGDVLYLGDQGGGTNTPHAGRVLAVNAKTGDLLWSTVINSNPFSIITQSPVVSDGVVYVGAASAEENAAAFIPGYVCCSFRGSFSALDATTGQILWTTYTVPDGYSGGAVWGSTPAIDRKSNTVYVTTGNNYSVPADVKTCQQNGGTPSQCLSPDDHVDAVMALDMASGQITWATGVQGFDDWIVSCIVGVSNCPPDPGPDFDFGSGANLFSVPTPGGPNRLLVGAGQKSGIYWALDAATGEIVWSTQAGPGSTLGGIEWGSATDGKRVYVAEANFDRQPYPNDPSLPLTGSYAALDAATGQILWQTPDPSEGVDIGMVTEANGVVYAGSMSGHMYALDAASGAVLKDFVGEGSSNAGPAIDQSGVLYWGNGYGRFGLGTPSTTFYAFSLRGK
jgi:polyvinyl alcohol dehydrogenase (cytochrome)